jgi:hypothetical protein
LIENDIEDVMGGRVCNGNLLNDIEHSWSKPSVKEGKLGVCAQKCGIEFDPYAEQFK